MKILWNASERESETQAWVTPVRDVATSHHPTAAFLTPILSHLNHCRKLFLSVLPSSHHPTVCPPHTARGTSVSQICSLPCSESSHGSHLPQERNSSPIICLQGPCLASFPSPPASFQPPSLPLSLSPSLQPTHSGLFAIPQANHSNILGPLHLLFLLPVVFLQLSVRLTAHIVQISSSMSSQRGNP